MKTKEKTLKQSIADCKFDWVNSEIENNFKAQEIRDETKLFHFNEYATSEEAITRMGKEGYSPANISELLAFAQTGWNRTDCVVALGSVAEVRRGRGVPCLGESDRERYLYLLWFDDDWDGDCRFLAVRNSQTLATQPTELGPSETFTLGLPDLLEINGVKYQKI